MKLCSQWLRSWLPQLDIDDAELAAVLTSAGLEVKRLEPLAPSFRGVVVGRVLSRNRHPNADRLWLCEVDKGAGDPVQIVCGAPVIREGGLYPLGVPGAVLQTPQGEFELGSRKLRGQVSEGMLCSQAELQTGQDADGIWHLGSGLQVGQDLSEALGLHGHILHFDLTPNRGDCLSVLGMAREVAALTGTALRDGGDEGEQGAVAVDGGVQKVKVKIEAPDRCGYLSCRVLEFDGGEEASTPAWMCERLRRGGMRAISPIVDVTNYVMLELGQPLHAFDMEQLRGRLGTRTARRGEKLRLLDGTELQPTDQDLLITSGNEPLSLAGIMGGERSGIGPQTGSLLLECAWFRPQGIASSARRHRLHTESSHRFERGVDPQLQTRAMERASELLLRIRPGRAGQVVDADGAPARVQVPTSSLDAGQLRAALGLVDLDEHALEEGWRGLGVEVEGGGDGWRLRPPSWRFDLACSADYIEEAARLLGFDQLPTAPPPLGRGGSGNLGRGFRLDLRRRMAQRGWRECLTYSFVPPEEARLCLQGMPGPLLQNPLASTQSMMRASLWPGLLAAARHNMDNRALSVRLFELGRCFLSARQDPAELDALTQYWSIGGVACGPRDELQRDALPQVRELMADLDALFGCSLPWEPLGGAKHLNLAAGCTDPQRLVGFSLAQEGLAQAHGADHGVIAALRPEVAKDCGLPPGTLAFECVLREDAPSPAPAAWRPFPRYPLVRRDLALVAPAELQWGALRDAVLAAAGPELVSLRLFDRFASAAIGEGRQSLAFTLEWQPREGTWDAGRIEAAVDAVLRAAEPLGATLRPQ